MATQIQIKSSTDKNLPDPNSLLRGELAYSYASGKIFVGGSERYQLSGLLAVKLILTCSQVMLLLTVR